jgi:hypothetical protein
MMRTNAEKKKANQKRAELVHVARGNRRRAHRRRLPIASPHPDNKKKTHSTSAIRPIDRTESTAAADARTASRAMTHIIVDNSTANAVREREFEIATA